jgi:hypothetical protein
MKLRNAIFVCLVLALFAAGCGADGGFELPPDIPGDGDFPIVNIEDPPADDLPDGDGDTPTFRPLNPQLTIDVPTYSHVGTHRTAQLDPSVMPSVDTPVATLPDGDDDLVDCEIFSEETADICMTMSCEDKEVCMAGDEFITCSDVVEWVDALPTKETCDALKRRAKRRCDTFDFACQLKKGERKRDAIECMKQLDMRQELVLESDCFEIGVESSATTTKSLEAVGQINRTVQRQF